jgi:hypothetical protein
VAAPDAGSTVALARVGERLVGAEDNFHASSDGETATPGGHRPGAVLRVEVASAR